MEVELPNKIENLMRVVGVGLLTACYWYAGDNSSDNAACDNKEGAEIATNCRSANGARNHIGHRGCQEIFAKRRHIYQYNYLLFKATKFKWIFTQK
jgi:hypothetical protein